MKPTTKNSPQESEEFAEKFRKNILAVSERHRENYLRAKEEHGEEYAFRNCLFSSPIKGK